MSDAKVVWVLGAGFSAPLGAPLLADFFSERMRDEACIRVDGAERILRSEVASVVYALYHHGRGERISLPGDGETVEAVPEVVGRKHWNDAEQFLERLDAAAANRNSFEANLLFAMLNRWDEAVGGRTFKPYWHELTMPPLARMARRIVAIECGSFLEGADVHDERWLPYRRWQDARTEGDTIVTFNYDLVIETLCDQIARFAANGDPEFRYEVPKMRARLPTELERPGGARVFKLHGSIDWQLRGDQLVRVPSNAFLDEQQPPPEIATPGNSKHAASRTHFALLWQAAVKAIKEADILNFVGYRFPESDAYARMKLLDAVRDSKIRAINIVLGLNNPHAQRVRQLAEHARAPMTARVKDMWTQDFIERDAT